MPQMLRLDSGLRIPVAVLAFIALTTFASAARAQPGGDGSVGGGLNFFVVFPQQEFRSEVDIAWGGGLFLLWNFAEPRGVGVRLEGLLVDYGGKRLDGWSSRRRRADYVLDTNHLILGALIGPQLSVPDGHVRPYLSAGIGPAFFLTTQDVRIWEPFYYDSHLLNSSTLHDDVALALKVGGGLWMRVARNAYITVSLSYLHSEPARYLTESGVRTVGEGFLEIRPVRTEVDLLFLEVGMSGILSWLH